jgi:hypothetical protein
MKITFTTLAFAVSLLDGPLVLGQLRERSLKSENDDVEGEATIQDGDCLLECEWKAKSHVDRIAKSTIHAEKDHRKLGVGLFDVECKVVIGDDEFNKEIEFPTGWVQQTQEADGSDDYYEFSISFTVCDFIHSFSFVCFGLSWSN